MPVLRERKNAKSLIVFIHGFMGGPGQFKEFAELAYREGYSVCAILLPGHGGSVWDFGRFGLCDWENHLQGELDRHRKTYQNIFLVGHSMGGLLALNASLVKQNHVCGVVLLSTPLKLDFRPHSLLRKASLIILPAGHAVKDSYWQAKGFSGFAICPNWIKPFCGFSRLLRKTQPILQHISVPVLAVHSLNDETVSFKSAGMFIESLRNTTIKHMTLEKSWHSYYTPIERELIQSALLEFYNECL